MGGFGFSGFSVRLASHVSPDSLSAGFTDMVHSSVKR